MIAIIARNQAAASSWRHARRTLVLCGSLETVVWKMTLQSAVCFPLQALVRLRAFPLGMVESRDACFALNVCIQVLILSVRSVLSRRSSNLAMTCMTYIGPFEFCLQNLDCVSVSLQKKCLNGFVFTI
jgi:hypothetical protein